MRFNVYAALDWPHQCSLLPPCRNSPVVSCPFFWCPDCHLEESIFLVMYFCLGFLVFRHFVLLSLWIDSSLMHAALKFLAVASVLPQKPSFTIICVIPAIIRVAPPDRQAFPLLSHRLCFGRLPWHGHWKMEGKSNVAPRGVSWRNHWLSLPLGEAQNVKHTDKWPPLDIDPWIGQ